MIDNCLTTYNTLKLCNINPCNTQMHDGFIYEYKKFEYVGKDINGFKIGLQADDSFMGNIESYRRFYNLRKPKYKNFTVNLTTLVYQNQIKDKESYDNIVSSIIGCHGKVLRDYCSIDGYDANGFIYPPHECYFSLRSEYLSGDYLKEQDDYRGDIMSDKIYNGITINNEPSNSDLMSLGFKNIGCKDYFYLKDYLDIYFDDDYNEIHHNTKVEYKGLKYFFDKLNNRTCSKASDIRKIEISLSVSYESWYFINAMLERINVNTLGYYEFIVPIISCEIPSGSLVTAHDYYSLINKIIFYDISLLCQKDSGWNNNHSMLLDNGIEYSNDRVYLIPEFSLNTSAFIGYLKRELIGMENTTDITAPFFLGDKADIFSDKSYEAQCRILRWLENNYNPDKWRYTVDFRMENKLTVLEKIIEYYLKDKKITFDEMIIKIS